MTASTTLTNEILFEILKEWSFWENPPPETIERKLALPKRLHNDFALIIQGVRRCGKSTLLSQLPKKYDISFPQCFYCNFEDPRLMNNLSHDLLSQILSLARKQIPKEKPCYFFFDEIQNVLGWEKWIHTQLERPKNNYFVLTGSNSYLLSGEFGTALTGRHISLELYPFSFSEYKMIFPSKSEKRNESENKAMNEIYKKNEMYKVNAKHKKNEKYEDIEQYLIAGGFPRALTRESSYELLQDYFNDIILRDVIKRVHARSPDAVKQVARMAFESCGSELSYRKIAAVTDLTVDTVKSYLEACKGAYLLFPCHFFAFSEKQQLSRQKKYYPIDSGMRYAVSNVTGRDLGKSLELMIFLRLKQMNEQVFYWQELHKGEVDFVTVNGKKIVPYQVTWEGPNERHEKALRNFYAQFPYAEEAQFITRENARDFL